MDYVSECNIFSCYKISKGKKTLKISLKMKFVFISICVLMIVEIKGSCLQQVFKGPPTVTQRDLTTVSISWKGLVILPECAEWV